MDKLELIKNTVTANGMREWTDERVGQAMREYADQQNAELRERVKELEGAIYTAIGILKITSSPYAQEE